MLARSFRFRIALLSTFLSGVVLIIFGLAFLQVIRQVALERVDREIRSLGESQLRFSRGGVVQITHQLEDSLRFVFGEEFQKLYVFEIERRGDVVFRSENWPDALSALPRPTEWLDPPPPPHDDRRPPPWLRKGEEGGGPFGRPPPRGPSSPPPPRRRQPPPPGQDGPLGPDSVDGRPPRLYKPIFQTFVDADGKKWRYGAVAHERALVRVGVDMARFDEDNRQYRNALLLAAPIALLLLAASGYWLAKRALRPIERITEKAARITARGLHERIPEIRSDEEFDLLVQVMNGMLERLERSFHQAARFAADAAHELKTPLTILQGQLEQEMQEARDGSPEQQVYSDLLGEVQRLRSIVRKLLLLAQADAGHLLRGQGIVEWSAIVEQVVDDTREAAPNLEVRAEIEPGIGVRGDSDLLTQLLHNLASNAVKFNQPREEGQLGIIEIRLTTAAGRAQLTFANTSAPVPEAELGRLFERFYRGDPSRNRRIEGVGLGLALSREIAHGHGGDLQVHGKRSGWITFVLSLPSEGAVAT